MNVMYYLEKVKTITLISAGLLSFFTAGSGNVIRVPTDFASIQQGIDGSVDGDTVLVEPGRYFENVNFRGKNIKLVSNYFFSHDTAFIFRTIIDGSQPLDSDSSSCVALLNAQDSTALVEGFTITNGTGTNYTFDDGGMFFEGGGIILNHSSATIKHNLIKGNRCRGGGGGISTMYGNPTILNNVIMDNQGTYACGMVLNYSGAIIKNNVFYHNYGGSAFGTGGIMVWVINERTAVIENNTMVGNISVLDAGAISVTSSPNTFIRNNIIWGNRQSTGMQVTGTNSTIMNYCNTEEFYSAEGNIQVNPVFENGWFYLAPGSPCTDAGSSTVDFLDIEDPLNEDSAQFPSSGGVRNDMGAYGGPLTAILPMVTSEAVYLPSRIGFGNVLLTTELTRSFVLYNIGPEPFYPESIACNSPEVTIQPATTDTWDTLAPLTGLTFDISWGPTTPGSFTDTVKIYHSSETIPNPIKILLNGNGKEPVGVPDSELTDSKRISWYQEGDILHIRTGSNLDIRRIQITDISGKVLKNIPVCSDFVKNSIEINTGLTVSGVYLLSIISDKDIITEKIFLE
jgi:hypothetical protein